MIMSYLVCLYQGPYATTTVTARLVKQQLITCITRVSHVYHAFLYIFLPSLHENDAVKLPNFKFCEGHEHKATTSFFFS